MSHRPHFITPLSILSLLTHITHLQQYVLEEEKRTKQEKWFIHPHLGIINNGFWLWEFLWVIISDIKTSKQKKPNMFTWYKGWVVLFFWFLVTCLKTTKLHWNKQRQITIKRFFREQVLHRSHRLIFAVLNKVNLVKISLTNRDTRQRSHP